MNGRNAISWEDERIGGWEVKKMRERVGRREGDIRIESDTDEMYVKMLFTIYKCNNVMYI